jgi:hypothetical protein
MLFGVLILGLIVLRLMLPRILLNYVNGRLNQLENYRGQVEDIDVNLWRGAYDIIGLKLEKTGNKVPVPFLDVERIDLSVEWSELIHWALVGEVRLYHPNLNFVKGPTKESSQAGLGESWIKLTEDLIPFDLNRLDILDGEIHYRDFSSDPKIDIFLDRMFLEAENLANSRKIAEDKFAWILIYNKPEEKDPTVKVDVDLDTFEERPTFDMKFSLKNLPLQRLNPFFKAYGKFDVEKGEFSLYSEVESSEGAYKGYVKPFFKDVKVINLKKDVKNPIKLAWEAIVGAAAKILQSKPKERVATKIPIEGNYESKKIDYWAAIGNLLKNAFIEAIRPGFEGTENKRPARK